jgi:formate C-acetyltransferase
VFDVYTPQMRQARHTHIITGLPDSYGRGRIIGDYRRIAVYGIDMLIEFKTKERDEIDGKMSEKKIKLREEAMEQLRALNNMKVMAASYGFDISKPATNAKEAIQ